MDRGFNAHVEISINARIEQVWDALINPTLIKEYMFGTTVDSNWDEGGAITWSGEWEGKR